MNEFNPNQFELIELPYALPGKARRRLYVPKDDRVYHFCLTAMRPWDFIHMANLYSRAARGGSFLEVGAHIGSDTVIVSDLYKTCVCFEPASSNVAAHQQNMQMNQVSNVRLYKAAVSDQSGTCRLFLGGTSNSGMHSLRQQSPGMNQYEDVPEVTLDSMLPELGNDFTFIKIDTEGHDIRVLQGARNFIAAQKQKPVIQMEFCPKALAIHGSSAQQLIGILDDLGYKNLGAIITTSLGPLSRSVIVELFDLWRESGTWVDLVFMG